MIIASENKQRPGKKNRVLSLNFREEDPIFKKIGLKNRYTYSVGLLPGATAGNHFHKEKKELFYCPYDQEVEITLEDPKTKRRKIVKVSNKIKNKYIILVYIKLGIAHSVKNVSARISSLTVLSNVIEHNDADDHPYRVTEG